MVKAASTMAEDPLDAHPGGRIRYRTNPHESMNNQASGLQPDAIPPRQNAMPAPLSCPCYGIPDNPGDSEIPAGEDEPPSSPPLTATRDPRHAPATPN